MSEAGSLISPSERGARGSIIYPSDSNKHQNTDKHVTKNSCLKNIRVRACTHTRVVNALSPKWFFLLTLNAFANDIEMCTI